MKRINVIYFVTAFLFASSTHADKIILSKCDNKKDGFLKNEYILDLDQSLMIRNFIFDDKTLNKHRITDLSVKKRTK